MRTWLAVMAVDALLFCPWLLFQAAHRGVNEALDVAPNVMLTGPAAFRLAEIAGIFYAQAYGFTIWFRHMGHYYAIAAVSALCAAFGSVTRDRGWSLVVATFFTPIVAAIVVTHTSPVFLVAERYFCLVSPFFWLLVAAALSRMSRLVATVLLAFFLLLNCVSTSNMLTEDEWGGQDFRAAAVHLQSQVRTGDVVVVVPAYARFAFDYYCPDVMARAMLVPVGLRRFRPDEFDPRAYAPRRVWLVLADPSLTDSRGIVLERLRQGRKLSGEWVRSRRTPTFVITIDRFD